ncbi:SlyX family protein [Pseudoxanthomonas sp. PXM02]|nr:SlyX family protein [Pseudoxanthomonas sp. PXM02]
MSPATSKLPGWPITASGAGGPCVQADLPLPGDALERRLVELETRLAFQEHSLNELSEALADAREENQRTALLLRHMVEELSKVRTSLFDDPASEPPPPHY